MGLTYKSSKRQHEDAFVPKYDSVEQLIEHYVKSGYQEIDACYKTPTRNVEAAKNLLKKARSAWEQNVKRKTQVQLNVIIDRDVNKHLIEELERRRRNAQNSGSGLKMISKDKLVTEFILKGLDRFGGKRNFPDSSVVQNDLEKLEEQCAELAE